MSSIMTRLMTAPEAASCDSLPTLFSFSLTASLTLVELFGPNIQNPFRVQLWIQPPST